MAHVITVAGNTPTLGQRVFLAPTASITGEVVMEDDSSAFYGVSVRGDRSRIVIGEKTNLQDNVSVHSDSDAPCILGASVSVGHGAVVHGCTVGHGALIGMNATVLSYSTIGEQSLIAAGSVVLEGTDVPPRSLVAGIPAKVRRELSDEEVAGLQENAEVYLALKDQHLEALISSNGETSS
ncbi:gamma carbonic anhydrase family protein [Nesterenkonia haasae]|uniref:gamma carbonic anhydrase family protein n=1 Tax=Nesterenkonia haasae TaxID=2587813 RepID=UPI0013912B40|nr:gamma carbonic anhydrase family protein [Nesterenkonia haasae]NDK31095.1 gamma carbonic anhydrase family protein [Nesterenkonia haasae]